MERVQFQQEQMLAELKDLVEKGLFTATETKQIMKKRTAFETALVRRIAKKSDFIRYATYEMGLEQLRRKRVERLHLPKSQPSISDFALVRRQFHVFERALKKFKSDVGLWIQYVEIAKREGARALVGRITARALQLHPNTPALYILAASHELSHLSPSSARTLLQRGIRLNNDSVELWTEYVKMELGFVEGLRRRWDILGIDVEAQAKGKEKAKEMPLDLEESENQMQVDEDDQDATRRAIMDGAIVKSVISSAAKSLPKIRLFTSLQTLITTYPSPPSLRESLVSYLLDVLRVTLPDEPLAIRLFATRSLWRNPELEGVDLIDALKDANECFLSEIRDGGKHGEEILSVYADWVEEWCQAPIDDNLGIYLVLSLRSLVDTVTASPSLYSTHLRLLISPSIARAAASPAPAKILKFARKYTSKSPPSASVWLARLDAEKRFSQRREVEKAWADARSSVAGDTHDVEQVWMWGLDLYSTDEMEDQLKIHERLLQESMQDSSRSDVHESLLMKYATLHVESKDRLHAKTITRKIATRYLATARVYSNLFLLQVKNGSEGVDDEGTATVLQEVFELWRKKDALEASVTWARWLFKHGRGKEAASVIIRARSWLANDETARMELEKRWTGVLEDEEHVEVDSEV